MFVIANYGRKLETMYYIVDRLVTSKSRIFPRILITIHYECHGYDRLASKHTQKTVSLMNANYIIFEVLRCLGYLEL